MFTITINFPVYVVLFLIAAGAAFGYALRWRQRLRQMKLIEDLENRRYHDNARIIELEKETLILESRLREWQIPVIPLKKPTADTPGNATPRVTVLDMSLRRQLQAKPDDNRQSASR